MLVYGISALITTEAGGKITRIKFLCRSAVARKGEKRIRKGGQGKKDWSKEDV